MKIFPMNNCKFYAILLNLFCITIDGALSCSSTNFPPSTTKLLELNKAKTTSTLSGILPKVSLLAAIPKVVPLTNQSTLQEDEFRFPKVSGGETNATDAILYYSKPKGNETSDTDVIGPKNNNKTEITTKLTISLNQNKQVPQNNKSNATRIVLTQIPIKKINSVKKKFSEWKVDDELMDKLLTIGETLLPKKVKIKPDEEMLGKKKQDQLNSDLLLLSNPKWALVLAPISSWTYCNQICGIDDQAVDEENALENANADFFHSVNAALVMLNLGQINENQLILNYTPPDIVLEESEIQHTANITRYRTTIGGKTVRYVLNENNSEKDFKVSLQIKTNLFLTKQLWETIMSKTKTFLIYERSVYFYASPQLIFFQKPKPLLI